MKAIEYTEYGPPEVLHLTEVEDPVPGDDEVLIRVRATTVTTGDVNARNFAFVPPGFGPLPRLMFGIRGPKNPIIGSDIAGDVAAVGSAVTEFKVGDPVYGMDGERLRAYAEFVSRPASGALTIKPSNLTYEEAATIPFGATTALYFLKEKGHIQSGQEVLVNGASGGVGTAAVQLAHHFGAKVTGVCSTANVDLVKSLGADTVIDYTKEDYTQNGQTYDIIFDAVHGRVSFADNKDSLKPDGIYLAVAGGLKEAIQMQWTSMVGSQKVAFGGGMACERKDYLVFLRELIEAGDFKPTVDRTYPFEQMAEAHRYVETGRKKGSVAITIAQNDQ